MNDIYQQLGAQLGQGGGPRSNPFSGLAQRYQGQAPQRGGGGGYGGGAAGNPFAGLFRDLGQQATMGAGGSRGQSFYPQASQPQRGFQPMGSGLAGGQPPLRGAPASPIPGYTTPAADQRNPYASTTPQAMDGTGWKDGMSPQGFQVANPYYGQTGYYGNLQQVQQQMAGGAQSAGIPQGVLGASTYTQNPAGQTPWVPDLTPQQKVDQDLANWEANRWNPK